MKFSLIIERMCSSTLTCKISVNSRTPIENTFLPEHDSVLALEHEFEGSNSILIITDFCLHDKVGDFGLARWQPDGDTGVETRVIGTFGYLWMQYLSNFSTYFTCKLL